MEKEKIVVASGYFDPLHFGHVEYLREAKKLGDKLIVIVNNSKQTRMKKGYEFMPAKERVEIIKALDVYTGLKVDTKPLLKQAKVFEEKLKNIVEKSHKAHEVQEEKMSYVG